MAIIEPVRQDVEQPGHIKKNSFNLRLWHWLNVIVISGSLLTVLANSTILSRKNVGDIISKYIQAPGSTINSNDTDKIAHDLNDSVWQVHIYFGILLTALLLYRIILEWLQPSGQHFSKKLKQAIMQYKHKLQQKKTAKHELTVRVLYTLFYILLVVMACTGLLLTFKNELGISRSISHPIKEIHGFCMYLIIAFILTHLVGVLLAEKHQSPGIISDMINGGQNES